MTKYEYIYDITTATTTRSSSVNYYTASVLESLFIPDRNGDKALNTLKSIYDGVAEEPLISIEEDWWSKQAAIQGLMIEIRNINEVVTQLEDVNIPQITKDRLISELTTLLGNYDDKTLTDDVFSYKVGKQKNIDDLIIERNNIEDGLTTMVGSATKSNEWLKAYRGVPTAIKRPTVVGVIPSDVRKRLIAHERNRTVRNLEDTVADLAKSNALLLSMVSAIYSTLSATAKAKIPTAEKAIIDYAVTAWLTTSSRGDRQLATEGTALIDKLYSREVAIADIVDTFK